MAKALGPEDFVVPPEAPITLQEIGGLLADPGSTERQYVGTATMQARSRSCYNVFCGRWIYGSTNKFRSS